MKRVPAARPARHVQVPRHGFVIRWGHDDFAPHSMPPCLVAAWSAGHKQPALTLLRIIDDHRAELEAAGLDLSSLRITGVRHVAEE